MRRLGMVAALALTCALSAVGVPHVLALDNGLARTPPMGWNSWNRFGVNINEQLIQEIADAMVSSGMKDAGYEYIVIDDGWMARERDAAGRLQPDPVRFPHGIKALADYVHARGLKLGIYSSAGRLTCQGLPASLGHEEVDAQTFAEWGVDYLKYDNCYNDGQPALPRYKAMHDALAKTGRPIVYSICEWGSSRPWSWAPSLGNLWRTTGDIAPSWTSVVSILDQQVGLEEYSRPGAWNDPDMLEVGNDGLTDDESRAHMSLWALLNAPLMAGNDLRTMSATTREILTNPEVIAVDQDWGGMQGRKIRDDGDQEVWAKPMSDGSVAVVLLNRAPLPANISVAPKELGLPASPAYTVRDLWTHQTLEVAGPVAARVPTHAAAMYRVWASPATGERPQPGASATTQPASAEPVLPFLEWFLTPAFCQPGVATPVQLTISNRATETIRLSGLGLLTPPGWTVTTPSTRELSLPAGQSQTISWTVTAAGFVPQMPMDLRLQATMTYKGQEHPLEQRLQVLIPPPVPTATTALSDLPWWSQPENGWGPVERNQSNGESGAGDGHPLTINGVRYTNGLGVHALSCICYYVGGVARSLTAKVGVDDEVGPKGSVIFEVWGDGHLLWRSPVVRGTDAAIPVNVDLSGVYVLELVVTDGGDNRDYDHADWAEATLTVGL